MITTLDDALAARMRMLALHGMSLAMPGKRLLEAGAGITKSSSRATMTT